MSDEGTLTPTERQLEAALGALAPAASGIDRDALMFRAGRASARRGMYGWRAGTLVLAAALTCSLVTRPRPGAQPRVVERVVRVEVEKPAPSPPRAPVVGQALPFGLRWAGNARYLKLRNEVLERGLSALPEPDPSAPAGPRETLEQLLGVPLPIRKAPAFFPFGNLLQGDNS